MELGEVRETRAWQAVRRHPQLCDAALALAVVVPVILAVRRGGHGEEPRMLGTADMIAAAIGFVAIAFRRRFTLAGLILTTFATILFTVQQGDRQPMLMIALVLLFFTHAAWADRRTAWLTAVCLGAVVCLSGVIWAGGSWYAPENLGALAWIGMATAVGDATRSRRAYVAEVEERARRAEQSRDEEARRQVVEERVRIARELHDVVAHHIAVIKVQATGAKHILHLRPEQVAPALDHISRSSDAVLKEIASVVGLLRSSDDLDGGEAPATEPTRGLARLSGLLDDLAAAGLRVDHHRLGEARELPALVDLAAFRIAQEALTNAQKYGDGTARLTVAYTADGVTLDITNQVRPDVPRSGSGYGIIGMRERAASTGGALTAGPDANGRFTVHTDLPSADLPSRDHAERLNARAVDGEQVLS
ncbi:sensor histidine kinase [Actinoplanes sp. CA-051413]|uniref:sensor histidine kinase n=1 Tax=Actinoplanes sp. CA-051413 TaxID=3239899 RepID=UPI003D9866FB